MDNIFNQGRSLQSHWSKQGDTYEERRAVRVIAPNSKGEFIIIHASKTGSKVPGSGIEYGEDHHVTCEREVMEEAGCKVTLLPAPRS